MNETELWAFGLVAAAFVGLGGILWKHMVSCSRDVAIPMTELQADMRQVKQFIGELREMKHLRVDPYLPRAFDELKKQVDEMEERGR